MKKILMVLAILTLTITGCGQRAIVEDKPLEQAGQAGQTGDQINDGVTAIADDSIKTDEIAGSDSRLSEIAGRYKTSSSGAPDFGDIFFEYDSYRIKEQYTRVLDDLSLWLINNNAIILTEGHCDERGTREYNLALGDRRALSVKDYLLAAGVPDLKIETVSYGEERPQCKDENDDCWAQNRRAHFVIEVVK